MNDTIRFADLDIVQDFPPVDFRDGAEPALERALFLMSHLGFTVVPGLVELSSEDQGRVERESALDRWNYIEDLTRWDVYDQMADLSCHFAGLTTGQEALSIDYMKFEHSRAGGLGYHLDGSYPDETETVESDEPSGLRVVTAVKGADQNGLSVLSSNHTAERTRRGEDVRPHEDELLILTEYDAGSVLFAEPHSRGMRIQASDGGLYYVESPLHRSVTVAEALDTYKAIVAFDFVLPRNDAFRVAVEPEAIRHHKSYITATA